MNEEEAQNLLRKVLQADRIIYEQQLGLAPRVFPGQDAAFRKGVDTVPGLAAIEDEQSGGSFGADGKSSGKQQNSSEKAGLEIGRVREAMARKFGDLNRFPPEVRRALELACREATFLVKTKKGSMCARARSKKSRC